MQILTTRGTIEHFRIKLVLKNRASRLGVRAMVKSGGLVVMVRSRLELGLGLGLGLN